MCFIAPNKENCTEKGKCSIQKIISISSLKYFAAHLQDSFSPYHLTISHTSRNEQNPQSV